MKKSEVYVFMYLLKNKRGNGKKQWGRKNVV